MRVDVRVQMFLDDDWVDVSAADPVQVLHEGTPVLHEGAPVTFGWTAPRLRSQQLLIRRGRSDRAAHAEPASVQVVLDNHDGQLTPDDPRSPWWPHLTLGTPLRVLVAHDDDWLVRFSGEVASMRPEWPQGDTEGPVGEALVHVQAAGVLRRLQVQRAAKAPLHDLYDRSPSSLVWPMEDGQGASRVPGAPAVRLTGSSPKLGSDTSLPGAGGPLPVLEDGGFLLAPQFSAPQPVVAWLIRLTPGLSNLGALRWTVGDLTLEVDVPLSGLTATPRIREVAGGSGTVTMSSVTVVPGVADWVQVQVRIAPGNSPTLGPYTEAYVQIGSVAPTPSWVFTDGTHWGSGPVAEVSPSWIVGQAGATVGWVTVGDAAVEPSLNARAAAAAGYEGETPTERITRLASTMGVDLQVVGDDDAPLPLGPQGTGTPIGLARDAAQVEFGILTEQLDQPGLRFRSRESIYNQAPALTLDATESEIANPFAPTLDDQRYRNQVEVRGPDGATVVLEDVQGDEGVFPESAQPGVASSSMLADQAGWRLHLGTWPGMRYPSLTVDLAIAPHLIPEVTAVREGDRIQVTGLPSQHPAGTVDLLVEGITESLSPSGWTVEFTCSPAGPWTVGVVEDEVLGRADTAGTVLAVDVDAETTTWELDTTTGPEWITTASHPTEFPFDLEAGGEVVTVTAITGTGTQVATVTRAVNGVSKPHAAGTPVSLAHPAVAAL